MCGYSGIVPLEFLCGYSVVVVDLWDPSVVTRYDVLDNFSFYLKSLALQMKEL